MTASSADIIPVIMCGGSGTRLWPASRESLPKQFLKLLGDLSTFQMTARRVSGTDVFQRPVVLASNDVRFIVAEQLAEIGLSADIILEPTRRDSAAAVAVAACQAARRQEDAVVVILAADHIIGDDAAFVEACQAVGRVAQTGKIMTMGIRPTFPATGYGYIKPGEPIAETGAFLVDRFVEKPDAAVAARYIEEGFLWNSGYFAFRALTMLGELEQFEPAILDAARSALEQAVTDLDFVRLDETAFQRAPRNRLTMRSWRRPTKAGVLPVEFPWSDIGTWGLLWEASGKDVDGNVIHGQVELLDAKNNFVHSEHLLATVVGLDNIVVIAQQDAVLVTSREKSERVKDLVTQLRASKRPEADEHLRMYRPWGWYQRIDLGPRFQVKRIFVKPGGRLSLQKHHHRAEHWIIVKGTAEVTVDAKVLVLHENEAAADPHRRVHRLANPGAQIPLEIIEVQVGSYTGEDDIVQTRDSYGR